MEVKDRILSVGFLLHILHADGYWAQVACDIVVAAGDAGIWQRIVRPTLQESTLAALQRLSSGMSSLSAPDARRLRGALGMLPNSAPSQRAQPAPVAA